MKFENFHHPLFGENVYLFSPEDDPVEVQRTLDTIYGQQEAAQFGDARYAVYFMPGEYDSSISVNIGFYTQVSGLGLTPDDTKLTTLRCEARWLKRDPKNHNATCNFWRGVENLSVEQDMMWAVSQATFMRNVHLHGNLSLHDERGWASGGFLANSVVDGTVDSGSQQQWFSRNVDWDRWIGASWNMVFTGIEAAKIPSGTWPEIAYTSIAETEEIREKPYLAYDAEKGFGVCVPPVRAGAVGPDWNYGEFLPVDKFYVAKADTDTAETMNAALAAGKHLFLTPGIYRLEEPLLLNRPGTICLGAGCATLLSMKGNSCMEIPGDTHVIVAGILFDAGSAKTDHLLMVGSVPAEGAQSADIRLKRAQPVDNPNADVQPTFEQTGDRNAANRDVPFTLLADLFFRVGGAADYPTSVECCIAVAQDHVIGDNFWVWRADHGAGVGWEKNYARNGIVVTGKDVTLYALMVEHFHEYQTLWKGENGKVIFYQSEIPYDVPEQCQWQSHGGAVNGFASYKVEDGVASHEAWGLGIYLYNRDAVVELYSAMEVPGARTESEPEVPEARTESEPELPAEKSEMSAEKAKVPAERSGVRVHNVCTLMLNGNPGITHVINGEGGSVMKAGECQRVTEFPSPLA